MKTILSQCIKAASARSMEWSAHTLVSSSPEVVVSGSPGPTVEQAALGEEQHVIKHGANVAAGLMGGAHHLHRTPNSPMKKGSVISVSAGYHFPVAQSTHGLAIRRR